MIPPQKRTQGFTLVELLVVIAIIGILAGFLAVGLPRALESAKIARLDNTFLQIRNILTEYYVDHGTFPPAYGYLSPKVRGKEPSEIINLLSTGTQIDEVFFLKPWMAFVEEHNNLELYDNFSLEYDTDRDGDISRLEYAPFGSLDDSATQKFSFPRALYDPKNVTGLLRDDLERQFDSEGPRPILYFPINKRQFRKVASVWINFAKDNNDPDNPRPNDDKLVNERLKSERFPPPNYDAYVLISVGPSGNTWGIIYELSSGPKCLICQSANYNEVYYYHILGMATYFMATRDAEIGGTGDGELDFDFRARTRRGQADIRSNDLPDPSAPRAFGPLIFVGEG